MSAEEVRERIVREVVVLARRTLGRSGELGARGALEAVEGALGRSGEQELVRTLLRGVEREYRGAVCRARSERRRVEMSGVLAVLCCLGGADVWSRTEERRAAGVCAAARAIVACGGMAGDVQVRVLAALAPGAGAAAVRDALEAAARVR